MAGYELNKKRAKKQDLRISILVNSTIAIVGKSGLEAMEAILR